MVYKGCLYFSILHSYYWENPFRNNSWMLFLRNFCKTMVRDTVYHVAHSLYHVRSSSSSLVEGKLFFSVSESDFSFPAAKNLWVKIIDSSILLNISLNNIYRFYIMWIFSVFFFLSVLICKCPKFLWRNS